MYKGLHKLDKKMRQFVKENLPDKVVNRHHKKYDRKQKRLSEHSELKNSRQIEIESHNNLTRINSGRKHLSKKDLPVSVLTPHNNHGQWHQCVLSASNLRSKPNSISEKITEENKMNQSNAVEIQHKECYRLNCLSPQLKRGQLKINKNLLNDDKFKGSESLTPHDNTASIERICESWISDRTEDKKPFGLVIPKPSSKVFGKFTSLVTNTKYNHTNKEAEPMLVSSYFKT